MRPRRAGVSAPPSPPERRTLRPSVGLSPRRTNRRRSSESRLRDLMSSNSALISAASNLVKTILLARSPSSSPSRRCSRESERRHLMPSCWLCSSVAPVAGFALFVAGFCSFPWLLLRPFCGSCCCRVSFRRRLCSSGFALLAFARFPWLLLLSFCCSCCCRCSFCRWLFALDAAVLWLLSLPWLFSR